MKSKIKKFINSKLFVFIITSLVFSTIGVSAATYFASSQVTYDNKTSGLQSTDVQGAIDELYKECKTSSIGGIQILEKVPIVTTGDGLYPDKYECRYFFAGTNPNNYIIFNNETWRIISVECDGIIKIIKDETIGAMYWNGSGGSATLNNWTMPATLNTYLNGTYYNGLNVAAKNQIISKDWSIGSVIRNNNLSDQINDEKTKIWNDKVALITASEYLRSNSNQNNCGTLSKYNNNYSTCKNTTWLYSTSYVQNLYTLTPDANQSDHVFAIFGYTNQKAGQINDYFVKYEGAIRPVVYISSEIQITGGDGSQSNPYTIK